jgi:hypothetical protein
MRDIMKMSKAAKARIKRMSSADRKALVKAAMLLADNDCITASRYSAIHRTCMNGRM